MIDCADALESSTLYAFIDGSSDEAWWRELSLHYESCPGCRCVMESERRLKDCVRDRSMHVMVPESLYRKTIRIFDNA